MRDLHKALAVVVACCIMTSVILLAAVLRQKPRLGSQELLSATRMAVNEAVEEAVSRGGLEDAEGFLNRRITAMLSSAGFGNLDAHVVRHNDFDPLSAFYFDVLAGGVSAEFRLEGIKDPLLAIRFGLEWVWMEDPHHPYEIHRKSAVVSDCLSNHYFHFAEDGPDFFARLENKSEDPYHYGVETFLVLDGQLAVDHILLGGGQPMDDYHKTIYGLS